MKNAVAPDWNLKIRRLHASDDRTPNAVAPDWNLKDTLALPYTIASLKCSRTRLGFKGAFKAAFSHAGKKCSRTRLEFKEHAQRRTE